MGILLILKVLFLFVAIWFGLAYAGRLIHNQHVSTTQLLIQAIGMTGFITLQWLVV